MAPNAIRVFYVKRFFHPIFADILARRPNIILDKLENHTPDDEAEPILRAAHVFSISSARDELDRRFHANRDLLARTPELLVVSTTGAGFDTVTVADWRACWRSTSRAATARPWPSMCWR
jgi:D-3-phosphoglycerate dehydrogenase / 2-oxoglutarate reductase